MKKNKDLVNRFFNDVFNAQDRAAADEIIAANFVAHHPAFPGGIHGPDGIMQTVAFFRAGFPDLNYQVQALIAEHDLVTARWLATGTHLGVFMGIAPTNRQVAITGIDIFRVNDKTLVEAWVSSDFFGLMQQIGGIPAPGSVPA